MTLTESALPESPSVDDLPSPPFEVLGSASHPKSPWIFNSPHSGSTYPRSFQLSSNLTGSDLRKSEDMYVDRLFAGVINQKIPLLRAHFPRAWLDVNREPYELDPLLFGTDLPSYANTTSSRVTGGLGTIPRVVTSSRPIYDSLIPLDEGLHRIESVYFPYHSTLRDLLDRAVNRFGYAVLVDCHSMPSVSSSSEQRPDIVLGDCHGVSCDASLTRGFGVAFQTCGYEVAYNDPYSGGYITSHYGDPTSGIHAIQIEINRGTYMNESTFAVLPTFDSLRRDINAIIQKLHDSLFEFSVAAE